MAKEKVAIPDEVATELLFLSDRTCCKCNVRGKAVQIHHIDENPANSVIENLAPLCFDCHNETMIKGGFSRQLNASQVTMYRNDWLERVKKRRDKADELASIQTVTGSIQTFQVVESTKGAIDELNYKTNTDPELLKDYLSKIILIHYAQIMIAKSKWDTGTTSVMNQGNSDLIDFYEGILVELSTFYPKGHFNNELPQNYFSEVISTRIQLNALILEPNGIGTGGTMMSTIIGGVVIGELRTIISDIACALMDNFPFVEDFDFIKWKANWNNS